MIKSVINTEINKFRLQPCLKGKDLYRRVGPRSAAVSASGSADDLSEAIPMSGRKLDQLEYMEAYDSMMSHQERISAESQSLKAKESEMEPEAQ